MYGKCLKACADNKTGIHPPPQRKKKSIPEISLFESNAFLIGIFCGHTRMHLLAYFKY